jgi:hypothetical protein
MSWGSARKQGGLQYEATYDEKLFGVGCDVHVYADLATGEVSVVAAMRRLISPDPAFQISKDDLVCLSTCIESAKHRVSLLADSSAEIKAQNINCSCGRASLVVVHPRGKPASFSLTIGLFHEHGTIDNLSTKEVDEAVAKMEALGARVAAKVKTK